MRNTNNRNEFRRETNVWLLFAWMLCVGADNKKDRVANSFDGFREVKPERKRIGIVWSIGLGKVFDIDEGIYLCVFVACARKESES